MIPFNIIKAVYGNDVLAPGDKISAAFYKCGDNTGRPHYGSWKAIAAESPDFHRPEFFGELVLSD